MIGAMPSERVPIRPDVHRRFLAALKHVTARDAAAAPAARRVLGHPTARNAKRAREGGWRSLRAPGFSSVGPVDPWHPPSHR